MEEMPPERFNPLNEPLFLRVQSVRLRPVVLLGAPSAAQTSLRHTAPCRIRPAEEPGTQVLGTITVDLDQ